MKAKPMSNEALSATAPSPDPPGFSPGALSALRSRVSIKGTAAAISRRHRSARLHALTLVPAALRQRRPDSARQLVRYAASPNRRV